MSVQFIDPLSVIEGTASAVSSIYDYKKENINSDVTIIKIKIYKTTRKKELSLILGNIDFFYKENKDEE